MAPIPFIIIMLMAIVISSLPLYIAVKLLHGRTNILKTAVISILAAIIVSAIEYSFRLFGGLLAFIVLIWIYHEAFRLKWWKAFMAWLLQLFFIALFIALAVFFSVTVVSLAILT